MLERRFLACRRRARGDFRRCRGARTACPNTGTSLRDRPSEHSVEHLAEPDDQCERTPPDKSGYVSRESQKTHHHRGAALSQRPRRGHLDGMKAILLVDHGSRKTEANDMLLSMAELVQSMTGPDVI